MTDNLNKIKRYTVKQATDTTPRSVRIKYELFSKGVTSLTAKEVMEILPCSNITLITWRKKGKNLPCEKRGNTYHYPLAGVNNYLAKNFYPVI